MPAEDPLLSESRKEEKQAKSHLDSLRLQFADDSPQVVLATEKFQLAQKYLLSQAKGVREKKTSDQVNINAALERERARRDVILSQIQRAEGRLPLKRMLTSDFDQLKNELMIRLEVRKTTETEYAKLRLSTVSAQSRLTVVDRAIPADGGKPGIIVLAAASIIGALACMVSSLSLEYSSLLRKRYETSG